MCKKKLGEDLNVKMHSIYCNIITNVFSKIQTQFDKNK